ncbi:MAG: hypothetical protein K2J13_01825 [Clostridia bacterium]|nr:hypothetical protein [Clostridia bacterium]
MSLYNEKIIYGEDIGITIATMFDAKRMVLLDYYGYHYIMHGTSITHKINPKTVESFVNSCANVKDIFTSKHYCEEHIADEMQRRLLIHIDWLLNVDVKDKEKKSYLRKMRNTEYAKEALRASSANLDRNNKIKKYFFGKRLFSCLCLLKRMYDRRK